MLPDVLVIGAQRCGTSSLYKYLGTHPLVEPSLRKETEYFSSRFDEGEAWYRAHFPLALKMKMGSWIGRVPPISFEATPDYLLDPRAAGRAAATLPDAKLIALFRDPVARAYSHYRHNLRLGIESAPFDEALEAETDRIRGEVERIAEDPYYPARAYRRYSYFTRGLYAEQLARWLHQYPRDHVLVVRTEELFGDTERVLNDMFEFVGLPTLGHRSSFRNYSYLSEQADRPSPMPEHCREWLATRFEEPNRTLGNLLGAQFDWNGLPRSGRS